MARFNACSELAKFWIQTRHGYLITESVPVPVPYNLSDIDILALHPRDGAITLPDGNVLGPRIIIEAKDEHDFDPKGREFAKLMKNDLLAAREDRYVPTNPPAKIKFSMLRQQHFEVAAKSFGTEDFDRLFIVHAMDMNILAPALPGLSARRIWIMTLPELVMDLEAWYGDHTRPAGLRHSPVGDLLHLLLGYCGLKTTPV